MLLQANHEQLKIDILPKGSHVLGTGRDSKVGRDVAIDPYIYRNYQLSQQGRYPGMVNRIGFLIPAEQTILREYLHGAALTPKGRFITWVACRNSYSKGWMFVQEKKRKSPLQPRLRNHLINMNNDHHLKEHFTLAKSIAMEFGRCLQFKRELAPRGMKSRVEIREIPIWDEYIEYDETGVPIMYRPIIRVGREMRQIELTPDDAELWIHNPDPFGNGYQGVSELIAAYRTIERSESIAQNFAEIVTQRGLGQLDIEVDGIVDENDANKWADVYKNLVQESIIVHSPDMKVGVTQGMQTGFNYQTTQNTYYEDTAAATGYPQMRMRGVQSGAVKGSETDQDNMAEVYASIQETSEKHMKRFYEILDPSLVGKQFEIEWDFTIKMDVQKRATVLATNINTVMAGAEILTMGAASEILGVMLTEDDSEREMLVQEFIDENFEVMENPVEGNIQESGNRPGDKGIKDTEPEALSRQQENPGGRGNKNSDSLNTMTKEELGEWMMKKGISYRSTNDTLKKQFGTGYDHNVLKFLRDR
jgi:hypothetical protein